MILAIDVGNSRVKFGLFDAPPASDKGTSLAVPARTFSLSLEDAIPWTELSDWLHGSQGLAVLAGPNPAGIERIRGEWQIPACLPPRVISDPAELGLEIRVDYPDRVGIDRLLNAVSANRLRPRDQIAIVVSSGTATTVDLISADGAFEGGAILPGFELAGLSLHEHTALLPMISPAELSAQDVPALGKNTRAAISSGLLYGQIGAIHELARRLAEGRQRIVIVTGGGGALLSRYLSGPVVLEPELAMRALAHLAMRGQ